MRQWFLLRCGEEAQAHLAFSHCGWSWGRHSCSTAGRRFRTRSAGWGRKLRCPAFLQSFGRSFRIWRGAGPDSGSFDPARQPRHRRDHGCSTGDRASPPRPSIRGETRCTFLRVACRLPCMRHPIAAGRAGRFSLDAFLFSRSPGKKCRIATPATLDSIIYTSTQDAEKFQALKPPGQQELRPGTASIVARPCPAGDGHEPSPSSDACVAPWPAIWPNVQAA